MQFLLLGLAALVVSLLLVQGFTRANAAVMARQLRLAGGAVLMGLAAILAVRGMLGPASVLAMLASGLMGYSGGLPWSRGGLGSGQTPAPGKSSSIKTEHLEVILDHDTGDVGGRVTRGMFAGRELSSLRPAEVALIWQDTRFVDPQSAQIIEAYLDRVHPSWREDIARGEREMRDSDGRMQPTEAYEILGLEPGATDDEVRRAHRELMLKLHPDRGGSTYLAAQVNEAKDILLGKSG